MAVSVVGLGVWTPSFPTAAAWQAGVPAAVPATPVGEGIPPRDRRRTTSIARMAADVLAQALAAAGLGASEVDLLLASVGGELGNTVSTLALLREDPPASSPLRFGASVHNAALGQLAIPWENRRFASALAARDDRIVATGLLEAMGRVASGTGPAAVVFADEAWPVVPSTPAAVAVVLADVAARSTGSPAIEAVVRVASAPWACAVPEPAAVDSPVRGALALADALLRGHAGAVQIGDPGPDGLAWTVVLGGAS